MSRNHIHTRIREDIGMRKFIVAVPIALLAIGGSTACATKKFVRTSVGEVNDKVDSMGKSLEETQERTRQNEGKIAVVDQKADAATSSARQANVAAGFVAEVEVQRDAVVQLLVDAHVLQRGGPDRGRRIGRRPQQVLGGEQLDRQQGEDDDYY